MTQHEFINLIKESLNNNFPKKECQERGNALVLIADIMVLLKQHGIITEN